MPLKDGDRIKLIRAVDGEERPTGSHSRADDRWALLDTSQLTWRSSRPAESGGF
jgi:hypothetical protein